MEFKDYYKVLGIERSASSDEVKQAYRKLAREYHPDVNKAKDAQERMQEINEAQDVLRDPEKRAAYDRLGARWQNGQNFQPPSDWDAGFDFHAGPYGTGDRTDHSAFFETLFGAARRGSAQGHRGGAAFRTRGEDHHMKIVIPLEDAYRGATHTLTLRNPMPDTDRPMASRERTLDVAIPKGVYGGQQIRLTGQGTPGRGGGPAGDLYLEVQFEPHRLYRVEGRDVALTLPVTPWEAALGASVQVPTPSGALEMNVPAKSANGRKLRLKGRGIPATAPRRPAGDFYVVLEIVLPEADSERAQALYRQMAQELDFNPRRDLEV